MAKVYLNEPIMLRYTRCRKIISSIFLMLAMRLVYDCHFVSYKLTEIVD